MGRLSMLERLDWTGRGRQPAIATSDLDKSQVKEASDHGKRRFVLSDLTEIPI